MLDYSLTPDQLAELKREHKFCKKRKEADRIKAVYLLGKGWTVIEIAEALLLEDDAIRRYFNLYKEGGLKTLLDNKHIGRMSYLSGKELALLEDWLEKHTCRTIA